MIGQSVLLGLVAIFLVIMGAVCWLPGEDPDGIAGEAGVFRHALWISYTLLVDPGTQTGLEPSGACEFRSMRSVRGKARDV